MIQTRSDMTVQKVDYMGGDETIIQAMMVSTKGAEALEEEATYGRIAFLMKNRHGTPFEHNSMMFYVEAPIFVFREFHRHRIGFSYNEVSGRYKELPPMFYVPDINRKLIQVGKPGHYEFRKGSTAQWGHTCEELRIAYEHAYDTYQDLLDEGVAKEVARACLPVAIYSAMFVTCNARSLMAFLSLRTKRDGSTFPSYPQREIELVAEQLEVLFEAQFPLTYAAFNEFGRVSP